MKYIFYILTICVLALSCRPSLKIGKTQEVITKVDTATVSVINNDSKVDSARLVQEVFQKVLKNKIDFNTFSAKVKVDYQSNDASDNATAYIRIQKDSLIWISLRGALGIEGARALITKDSVIILNTLKKEVVQKSINFLQELTKLPFNFYTLQDLIIGNPVFVDSNIVSYETSVNNELVVLMAGKIFENEVTLNNNDFKMLQSKLVDSRIGMNRTCTIVFSDYDMTTGVPFALKRTINITEKTMLNTNLDFKSFSFNQSLSFPFEVTHDYKAVK